MAVISSKGNSSRLPANILDVFMWQGKHASVTSLPSPDSTSLPGSQYIYLFNFEKGKFFECSE